MWRWLCVIAACGGSSGKPPVDGPTGDGALPITATAGTWTWIPIDGMQCADGSPTGIGVNLSDASPNVLVYMQGGGACWDLNTCFTINSAVHITGGYGQSDFTTDIGTLSMSYLFQRVAANPFQNASWIYVPYCTGDLHDGAHVAMYDATHVVHHVGRTNASALLPRVAATRPNADVVWLLGISAGGYGVAFDWDLGRAAWPRATVHSLADSSPLVTMEPTRWPAMQASWQMTFPPTCTGCATDLGAMPAALRAAMPAGARYGLLANTRDQTISTYFGLTQDQLATEILAEQAAMAPGSGQAAYLLGGTGHVLLGNPTAQTTTGVTLSTWVAQWATGDAAWGNTGP
jgi:hypothetical protein